MRHHKVLYISVLLTFILSLVPITAIAEDQSSEMNALTIDQAVKLAFEASKPLRQAKLEIERNEEVRNSVADKVKYTPEGPASPQAEAAFTGLIAADIGLQMSIKARTIEEDKIKNTVIQKYNMVLKDQSDLDYAVKALESAQNQTKISQLSLNLGTMSDLQMATDDLTHQSAKTTVYNAQLKLNKDYESLNSILGLGLDQRPQLVDKPVFTRINVTDIDTEITRIVNSDPSLWMAEQNISLNKTKLGLHNWAESTGDPYRAKEIDVEKSQLTSNQARQEMSRALRSLYTSIEQLEEGYAIQEKKLKLAQKDLAVKKLMYEIGMLSRVELNKYELEVAKSEIDLNNLIYEHENLKQAFKKPWAATATESNGIDSGKTF